MPMHVHVYTPAYTYALIVYTHTIHTCISIDVVTDFTPFTKINLPYITDLNVNYATKKNI